MKISGKVAIVTGASSGIGLATARLFTQQGAKVALASRSAPKLKKIAKTLPWSLPIPTDMTVSLDIKRMVKTVLKHFGRIDILVNNAGRGYDASLEEINVNKLRQLIELDVIGPLYAMQLVIPVMRKQGAGAIVNISSGTSLLNLPNMSAYSSVKRMLNGLTLTAREELSEDNIRVSLVYPYITKTDFEKNTMTNDKTPVQFSEDDMKDLPPFDNPQHVAEKIAEAITSNAAEVFAHDWMKKRQ